MKETGLLFTGEMVRAKLEGRKTQTRRIVKPQPEHNTDCPYHIGEGMDRKARICPYGQPGDRIWVRERQRVVLTANDNSEIMVEYEADGTMSHLLPYPARLKWVPEVGLHLPYGGYRESSRITLEIVNIRVERLQEISEEDAIRG